MTKLYFVFGSPGSASSTISSLLCKYLDKKKFNVYSNIYCPSILLDFDDIFEITSIFDNSAYVLNLPSPTVCLSVDFINFIEKFGVIRIIDTHFVKGCFSCSFSQLCNGKKTFYKFSADTHLDLFEKIKTFDDLFNDEED